VLHTGLIKATRKTLPIQNPDLQKTGEAMARKRTKKPHEDEEARPILGTLLLFRDGLTIST